MLNVCILTSGRFPVTLASSPSSTTEPRACGATSSWLLMYSVSVARTSPADSGVPFLHRHKRYHISAGLQ